MKRDNKMNRETGIAADADKEDKDYWVYRRELAGIACTLDLWLNTW